MLASPDQEPDEQQENDAEDNEMYGETSPPHVRDSTHPAAINPSVTSRDEEARIRMNNVLLGTVWLPFFSCCA